MLQQEKMEAWLSLYQATYRSANESYYGTAQTKDYY